MIIMTKYTLLCRSSRGVINYTSLLTPNSYPHSHRFLAPSIWWCVGVYSVVVFILFCICRRQNDWWIDWYTCPKCDEERMRRSYEHLHVCNIDYSILSDVYLSIYIYVNTIPCILWVVDPPFNVGLHCILLVPPPPFPSHLSYFNFWDWVRYGTNFT